MQLDVRLDDQAEDFRRQFRSWLSSNLPDDPLPSEPDERFAFCLSWQRTLHSGGWSGINWPTEYGGRGATPTEQFVYYEELARAGAPPLVNQPGVCLLGPTLMVHGDEDLKQRFLPGIISARDVWCQGFSEPGAGSDLAALTTTARLDNDEYVINGQKIWTSFAQYAHYCAVLVREPGTSRHEGVSMVIVDLDQDGVAIRPIQQLTGEFEFSEVFYDDVRTPAAWVIGGSGKGWTAAMTMLEFERSDQGFTNYGTLLSELEATRATALAALKSGKLDRDGLAWFRRGYAENWVRVQSLRGFNLDVAARVSKADSVGHYGSIVKMYWSELAQSINVLALELCDAIGEEDDHVRREYLFGRSHTVASGTSEINRNIIAERILGLPR